MDHAYAAFPAATEVKSAKNTKENENVILRPNLTGM